MGLLTLTSLQWAPFQKEMYGFQSADRSWNLRQGFFLRAQLDDGQSLVAEASPLVGYSRDTFAHILEVLSQESASGLLESAAAHALPPSLQCAVESLSLLSEPWPDGAKVESNAVVGLGEDWNKAAESARQKGYRSLKLKISPTAAPLLRDFVARAKGRWKLRLDANSSFSVAEWLRLSHELDASVVEYCEDVVPWEKRQSLEGVANIPLAWDQALDSWERVEEALQAPWCQALVLKPMVLGGWAVTSRAIAAAEACGKSWVITSALEAEPGRRALLSYLATRNNKRAAGVSTGHLFRESFLADSAFYSARPEPAVNEETWLASLAWRGIRQ